MFGLKPYGTPTQPDPAAAVRLAQGQAQRKKRYNMRYHFDFVVVGSGIAGLSLGLKLAERGSVCIITKANEDESNTKYAQGGVAVVSRMEADSFAQHIADTEEAGDGACMPEAVKVVVTEGPDAVREIIDWGARFDKTPDGEWDLAREGGHSAHRVLHHKDMTGFEIERALLSQVYQSPNITLWSHKFAIDLITQHHLGVEVNKRSQEVDCYGVYVLDTASGAVDTILGRITILATGGAGQVYASTTNPLIATGDGVAMAYRAKARVENMEFIQFHPTALYNPGEFPSFLISEAVRGYGGVLKNRRGEEFMHRYDKRKSLAPRDIVARAIDSEMKRLGDEHVWLDCRSIDVDFMRSHFPNIYQKCLSIGIDMQHAMVPVVPAQHYMVGGIKVDLWGRSSIRHLYACGECSSTGLHGANRLASNSLLEALVFANRIARDIGDDFRAIPFCEAAPDWDDAGTAAPPELVLISQNRREVQAIMSGYVGIVRTNVRLDRALERLLLIYRETELMYKTTTLSVPLLELRNLLSVAYTIVKSAKLREESRGLHFNTDFPGRAVEYEPTVI